MISAFFTEGGKQNLKICLREKGPLISWKIKLKKKKKGCSSTNYLVFESKGIFFTLQVLNAIISIIFTSAMPWGPM